MKYLVWILFLPVVVLGQNGQFGSSGGGITAIGEVDDTATGPTVTLVEGSNVTISRSGNSITITAAVAGGGDGDWTNYTGFLGVTDLGDALHMLDAAGNDSMIIAIHATNGDITFSTTGGDFSFSDDNITTTGTITGATGVFDLIDPSGAVDLDLGSVDVTDVTITTDGGTVIIDGDITLDATNILYLDGGDDTHISENSANQVRVMAGNNPFYFNSSYFELAAADAPAMVRGTSSLTAGGFRWARDTNASWTGSGLVGALQTGGVTRLTGGIGGVGLDTLDNLTNKTTTNIVVSDSLKLDALTASRLLALDGNNYTTNTLTLAEFNASISDATVLAAEVNDLETDGASGIADTEIPIGTGAGTVNYAALSGHATMTNGGVVTVSDFTLSAEADANGNNIINLGDVTFQTGASGGTLRTGTSAADRFQLQVYDVDNTAYRTVLELDAGNSPTATFNPNGDADLDINFEGDTDGQLLYLDSSADSVGIGTSTPAFKLDVDGSFGASSGDFEEGNIVNVGNISIDGILPDATDVTAMSAGGDFIIGGGATASNLRLLEPSGSGTNYTQFVAQAQAAIITYTLPPDDGDAGEQLQTDGSGGLTWEAAGSGGGGSAAGGDSVHVKTFHFDDFIPTVTNDSMRVYEQGYFRDRVWWFQDDVSDTLLCKVQWRLPDNFGAFLGIGADVLNLSDTSDDTIYVHMEGIANDEAYPTDLSLASEAALIRFASGPAVNDLMQAEDTSVSGTYAADDVLQILIRRPSADAGLLGFKNLNLRWRED